MRDDREDRLPWVPTAANPDSHGGNRAGGRLGTEHAQRSARQQAVGRWALRASDSQFNALAGAIAGLMSGIFTCPLDVIKTKLQAQGGFAALHAAAAAGAAGGTRGAAGPAVGTAAAAAAGQNHHRLYNGLVGTARVIWRDEGVRGLYRGLGPIIMGYLPTWAVWFTIYNKSKLWMGERYRE